MRKQVLRSRAICRNDLLNREKTLQEKTQVAFNLTYYPVFIDVRKILKELHLLLTPDQSYKKVFSEVPIIGFKNAKSLKDHLVRAVLPQLDREGRYKPCEGENPSCEVCHSVKETTKFKKQSQKKLLTFLKALWIVIRTMWYTFLNAKNVSLNSLMLVVRLQSFDLDLTTIKVLIVSLERN